MNDFPFEEISMTLAQINEERIDLLEKKYKPQKQKHEKIKQMAWELFLHSSKDNRPMSMGECWNYAEKFRDFAKEEEEANDAMEPLP